MPDVLGALKIDPLCVAGPPEVCVYVNVPKPFKAIMLNIIFEGSTAIPPQYADISQYVELVVVEVTPFCTQTLVLF